MSKKQEFIDRLFNENIEIFENYMKETGCNKERAKDDLTTILNSLNQQLHLEKGNDESFKVKEVQNFFPVKLGYFEIRDGEDLNPEMYVEQCPLIPTEKGKKIYEEYSKLK